MTQRVQRVLRALPSNVTPVNLEELRRVKQLLVELESKADMLRCAEPVSPFPASGDISSLTHSVAVCSRSCTDSVLSELKFPTQAVSSWN